MKFLRQFITLIALLCTGIIWAWEGMEMPVLHVEGRYLTDSDGNIVNLHGFAQTYSPWFNEQGTKWTNYDVNGCLNYNKKKIDDILRAGWKMNFVRMHMDPYWSNTPGVNVKGENDISAFNFDRFCEYLDKVFIPMAEYAVSKGLYVVMRPPGVCPENIEVNGEYHKYLKKVWNHVSSHSRLNANPHIMFELANEPINIKGTDGHYGSDTDACFRNLTVFFQEIVDLMRGNGCENILWIPGTAYQSQYAGFAKYPVKGDNIGYAVHVYPGWYGSDAIDPSHELGGVYGGGFNAFASGWASQIKPVADFAPVMVTELDWAHPSYNASWGKSITGEMFGEGFGANFKLLADNTGNVSWLIFTGCELLASFKDTPGTPGAYNFLNDPQACPWAAYHWYKEYAGELNETPVEVNMKTSHKQSGKEWTIMQGGSVYASLIARYAGGYESNIIGGIEVSVKDPTVVSWADGAFSAHAIGTTEATLSYNIDGKTVTEDIVLNSTPFPLLNGYFNPSIWTDGTLDDESHTIRTGQWGFGGWKYPTGLDLSDYRYLIAEMDGPNNAAVSFRVFDIDNYWSDPAMADFGSDKRAVFELGAMKSDNGRKLDPTHLYIIGFWSNGNASFKISKVYLSDNPDGEAAIDDVLMSPDDAVVDVYDLHGVMIKSKVPYKEALDGLNPGIYVVGGRKIAVLK